MGLIITFYLPNIERENVLCFDLNLEKKLPKIKK